MVTHEAARLMDLTDYGIAPGKPAALAAPDAADAAEARWGITAGRDTFSRPGATLHSG